MWPFAWNARPIETDLPPDEVRRRLAEAIDRPLDARPAPLQPRPFVGTIDDRSFYVRHRPGKDSMLWIEGRIEAHGTGSRVALRMRPSLFASWAVVAAIATALFIIVAYVDPTDMQPGPGDWGLFALALVAAWAMGAHSTWQATQLDRWALLEVLGEV